MVRYLLEAFGEFHGYHDSPVFPICGIFSYEDLIGKDKVLLLSGT